MKFVKIRPVAKPKSFAEVKFTEQEWNAAVKAGSPSVPYVTALEALKQSRGLYEIEPEKKPEVELKVGGLTVSQMGPAELKLMAVHLGCTIRKKNIKLSELRKLVTDKLEAVEVEDDDDIEIDDEDDETSPQEE